MSTGTSRTRIDEWIAASNAHDTAAYLAFFTDDAVLDDPSVGDVFEAAEGLRRYFETYVIGYATQTRVLRVTDEGDHVHVEVEFTGTFPGNVIRGYFDIRFAGDRFAFIKADLM